MDNIKEFPIYNLYNIPEALRKVANEIEKSPEQAKHIIIVIQALDDSCNYKAFGKDFNRIHALGLLEYGKILILGGSNQ